MRRYLWLLLALAGVALLARLQAPPPAAHCLEDLLSAIPKNTESVLVCQGPFHRHDREDLSDGLFQTFSCAPPSGSRDPPSGRGTRALLPIPVRAFVLARGRYRCLGNQGCTLMLVDPQDGASLKERTAARSSPSRTYLGHPVWVWKGRYICFPAPDLVLVAAFQYGLLDTLENLAAPSRQGLPPMLQALRNRLDETQPIWALAARQTKARSGAQAAVLQLSRSSSGSLAFQRKLPSQSWPNLGYHPAGEWWTGQLPGPAGEHEVAPEVLVWRLLEMDDEWP